MKLELHIRRFAPVALTAFAAACAGGGATGSGTSTATAQAPAAPRANPADAQFLSGMIHHHAQALIMAAMAATHGASEQIRTLAQRIHVSQTDEIRSMQQWLREHGEPAPEPSPKGQRMVMADGTEHHMLMHGMLTDEQVAQLDAARGRDFDRLFLEFMIQHHRGAQKMVEELFATHGGGVDDFIYKIASDTFADQGSEIDRMQRMLDAMGGGGDELR